LKNAGILIRHTYNSNDPTDPRQPLAIQHPKSITEVSLNDESNKSSHKADIYAAEMGMQEVVHVAKSSNKPIVEIKPREYNLNSLQQEGEISCVRFALSQKFQMISKTNL
jgi:hypothetical protein